MQKRSDHHRHSAFARGLVGIVVIIALGALIAGCASDPIQRQETLTTFFDGVPPLPPVQELCQNQLEVLCKEYNKPQVKEGGEGSHKRLGSIHPPYAQKKCKHCHDFKSANLLIRPKNQLCFVCHKHLITGSNVHGPVSVGACLACHFPHDSKNSYLLRLPKTQICMKCHRERRLAYNMHKRVIAHGMTCVDCHDPHSGNARYFLK